MKSYIEIPKQADLHATSVIDANVISMAEQRPMHEKDMLLYHKGFINLRSIVDFFEMTIKFDVIDEEKFPEYKEKQKEWADKMEKMGPPMGLTAFPTAEYMGPDAPAPGGVDMPSMEAPAEMGKGKRRFLPITAMTMPQDFPRIPMKTKTIKVVTILYYFGAQRMITDDFKEFSEKYFNYLQSQKLDFDLKGDNG